MAAVDQIPNLYEAILPSSSQTSYMMPCHSIMVKVALELLTLLGKLFIIFQQKVPASLHGRPHPCDSLYMVQHGMSAGMHLVSLGSRLHRCTAQGQRGCA